MPEPENNTVKNTEQIQQQPMREITQTDHLNKKLLTSLFKRLDEADSTSNVSETENTTEDDEWKE
ncbi:uncharacterized protein [Choristoneura fumiferana]|uniref:uncharacterized protein n=1 Tax=Choristoneura fumiferana TaxID=7141 RepID=UPI003D15F0F5